MTDTAKPKYRRLTPRELKRIDVQAHNQAFDELKVVKYRFTKYIPNDDLFARKKQIASELERKASLIP